MHRIETKPREFIAETSGHLNRTLELGFKSKEHLLRFIKGKKILDLGSGAGHFAKEAYSILGNQTFIVSMNPRLADSFYLNQHKKLDKELTFNNSGFGIKRYSETALAANWHNLPFAPASFDCIFATGSFLFYCDTYDDSVLSSLIDLIKKETGEIRIEISDISPQLDMAINFAKNRGCKTKLDSSGGYLLIKRGKV